MILRKLHSVIRYSPLYPFYLRLFRAPIYEAYKIESAFYRTLLRGRSPIVFDIGANVGDKSAKFSRYSRLVIAVEPDLDNHRLLRKRFFFDSRVRLVNAAVGDKTGKEILYVNSPGSPSNTLSVKWKQILEDENFNRWSTKVSFSNAYEVDAITLDSLIADNGFPFYIKIDVEGFENRVLAGLSKAIPVVSFEANFPDFKDETVQCVHLLAALSKTAKFNVLDDNFRFFWKEHEDLKFTLDWLENTELKYFEVFCFSDDTDK
jgi:FkbM family methyltransferase